MPGTLLLLLQVRCAFSSFTPKYTDIDCKVTYAHIWRGWTEQRLGGERAQLSISFGIAIHTFMAAEDKELSDNGGVLTDDEKEIGPKAKGRKGK